MTTTAQKPPIWFWIVSVIALLWNVMGVKAYLDQAFRTETFKTMYTTEQIAMIDKNPTWVTAAFAIAVFGAFLGCIALLLRKKIANTLFIISFLAVIAQSVFTFFLSEYKDQMNSFETTMSVMIPIIAILLIIFSNKGIAKGWLK